MADIPPMVPSAEERVRDFCREYDLVWLDRNQSTTLVDSAFRDGVLAERAQAATGRAFTGDSLIGTPVECSAEEASALHAEGARAERARLLAALREYAISNDNFGFARVVLDAADRLEKHDG